MVATPPATTTPPRFARAHPIIAIDIGAEHAEHALTPDAAATIPADDRPVERERPTIFEPAPVAMPGDAPLDHDVREDERAPRRHLKEPQVPRPLGRLEDLRGQAV